MPIHVTSEIGPLRRVLLQRPGRELEHLSPETMEQLLFDDIPFLHRAQQEHDRFAELLRENGAEVVYLDALTAEVLAREPSLREPFVQDVIEKAGGSARGYREALTEYLLSVQDAEALVRKTMAGVMYEEVFGSHAPGLSGLVREKTRFLMPPIPNLYFTRDPFRQGRESQPHVLRHAKPRDGLRKLYPQVSPGLCRAGAALLYAAGAFLYRRRRHSESERKRACHRHVPADAA